MLTCAALEGMTFTAQAVAEALELDAEAMMDFWDAILLDDEISPGLLAELPPEEQFVSISTWDGEERFLNRYRFAWPHLWYFWAHCEATPVRQVRQRRLADSLERVYGPARTRCSTILIGLFEATGQTSRAAVYHPYEQRRLSLEALRWQVRILESLDRDPGRDVDLFELRLELSERLREDACYEEGSAQATQAIAMARAWEDRAREARALYFLGLNVFFSGQWTEAYQIFTQGLELWQTVRNREDAWSASFLSALGQVLREQGKLEAAHAHLERALAIQERTSGPEHPWTAATLHALGRLFYIKGCTRGGESLQGCVLAAPEMLAMAQQALQRALAIREARLGAAHPKTAATLHLLGDVLHRQKDFATAQTCYERALSICIQRLGASHRLTQIVQHHLTTQGQSQEPCVPPPWP